MNLQKILCDKFRKTNGDYDIIHKYDTNEADKLYLYKELPQSIKNKYDGCKCSADKVQECKNSTAMGVR